MKKYICMRMTCLRHMLHCKYIIIIIYLLLVYIDIHSLQTYIHTNKQTNKQGNYLDSYVHFNTANKQTTAT